jgi:hypothetical protein
MTTRSIGEAFDAFNRSPYINFLVRRGIFEAVMICLAKENIGEEPKTHSREVVEMLDKKGFLPKHMNLSFLGAIFPNGPFRKRDDLRKFAYTDAKRNTHPKDVFWWQLVGNHLPWSRLRPMWNGPTPGPGSSSESFPPPPSQPELFG